MWEDFIKSSSLDDETISPGVVEMLPQNSLWRRVEETQKNPVRHSPGGPGGQGLLLFISIFTSSQCLSSHQPCTRQQQAGNRGGGKGIAVFVESQQVPRVLCQSFLQPLSARACHLPKGHHAARRDSQGLAAPFICHVKTGCRGLLCWALPNQFKPNLSKLLSVQ